MKNLAAVTVVFLPGTFMASLFAMPFFDWNAATNSLLVSDMFWVYWAITVPLTLTTLAFWLLWTHRQTLIHREQDRKANEQFDNDLA